MVWATVGDWDAGTARAAMVPIVTSLNSPGVAPSGVRTIRARVGGASPWPLFLICSVTLNVSPQDRVPGVDSASGVTAIEVPTRFAGWCGTIVRTDVSSP